jgi:hypothetical protein
MASSNIAEIVDQLGIVKAKMAELATEENSLKTTLLEMGPGAYEGEFFRAAVSVSTRDSLDMDAVRAKLSAQFIQAHTKTSEVRAVRVSARSAALASMKQKAA